MGIKSILKNVITKEATKAVIGKSLPLAAGSPLGKKAKIAAVLAAGAGLLGAVSQYLS
jgi:hypothetical protein